MKRIALVCAACVVCVSPLVAQQGGRGGRGGGRLSVGVAPVPLPDTSIILDTAEQHRIRAVVVTKALSHPWGMAWLPNGDLLVTERPGRLRIVRNGALDPTPISGLPPMHVRGLAGFLDVALHPNFARNHLVYFSYVKDGERGAATAVFRGTLDGMALTDVRDVFVTESWMKGNDLGDGRFGSRLLFLKDGTLLVTVGDRDRADGGQNLADDFGKVVRVNDDGSIPKDNPFIGRAGYRPEIYTFGQRNQQGMAFNPVTGDVWASEQGPNGGDEINVIKPGRNYGWPYVSYGRKYAGPNQSDTPAKEGIEQPIVYGCRRLRCRGSRSIPGTSSRRGRTTRLSAPCARAKSIGRAISSGSCSTTNGRRSAARRFSRNCASVSGTFVLVLTGVCTC